MKKLIVLSLAAFLCLPITAYSAGIGEAETHGQGNFNISLDQEFISSRDGKKYKDDLGEGEGLMTLKMKSETEMSRTMIKSSYGLFDSLDVYVMLGIADFESKLNYVRNSVEEREKGSFKLKGDDGAFAYGFGMKAKYDWGNNWIVGCDAQYLTHENNHEGTISVDGASGEDESLSGTATFQEWHVAPYIAKKLGSFVPYLGVKYLDAKTEYEVEFEDGKTELTLNFKIEDNIGVFLGTDYQINDVWSLNLEARFVNETAVSFGGTCRF